MTHSAIDPGALAAGAASPQARLVVLISGRGSNYEALQKACLKDHWPAQVVAVVSNRPDAGGLAVAARFGVPVAVVPHQEHPSREAFDARLMEVIDAHRPDWVVLAGFMRILTPGFVAHYRNRLINIHPSLLPSFPGLNTHARALAAGVAIHGATVHLVTEVLDHGPILLQGVVGVLPTDDPQTLAARVLRLEHQMFPEAIRRLVTGQVTVGSGGDLDVHGLSKLLVGEGLVPGLDSHQL